MHICDTDFWATADFGFRRQRPATSFDLTLSADQLKTLDEASQTELGFPYDLYAKAMARAICYGGMRDQILA